MSLVTRSIVLAAAIGLVATGCSGGTAGSPTPAGTTSTSTSRTSDSSPSTSASAGSGASLASFDSCQALTAVAAQFKLTEVEEVGKQECSAEYGATSGVGVSLKAWPDLKVQDIVGGPNSEYSDVTIGSRKARLVKKSFTDSACSIAVEVGATSRVDVVASANASLDDACNAATALATAVEPTLPK